MNGRAGTATGYTEFHPRWYRRRVSTYWWLARWVYVKFIVRELSSLGVAWFVIVTLLEIAAIRRGPQAYDHMQRWLQHPVVIAVDVIAFLLVLYHTITWFNLAPRAMAVRVRGKRVPEALVAAPNYVAWIAVTAFVAWILLRSR